MLVLRAADNLEFATHNYLRCDGAVEFEAMGSRVVLGGRLVLAAVTDARVAGRNPRVAPAAQPSTS